MEFCRRRWGSALEFVQQPSLWLVINAVAVGYSLLLLVFIALKDPKADHFARNNYFVYNITTSILWVLEASGNLEREKRQTASEQENDPSEPQQASTPFRNRLSASFTVEQAHRIEIYVAIYFVIDSIIVIVQKHRGEDHTKAMAIDVIISIISFSYETYVQWKYRSQKRKKYLTINDVQQ
jgi:hypothetical protein